TGDERLKVIFVRMLGVFAMCSYELVPRVVPQLYKHLVDFDSRRVRAAAIGVVGVMMGKMPGSVPDEMIDLLAAYLDEKWVIIHKATVRTLQHYRFSRDERGARVLNTLLGWEGTYVQKESETDFLQAI